jgi:hypothetical protein
MEGHAVTNLTATTETLPIEGGTGKPRAGRPVLLAVLAATAIVEFGTLGLGWWWIAPLAGLAVAAVLPGRWPVAAVAAGTVLAWTASLLWQSEGRALDVADLVGAMALNARGLGWAIVAVTLLYAVLLTLTGAWLGAAARRFAAARRARRAAEPEPAAAETENSHAETRTEEEQHV